MAALTPSTEVSIAPMRGGDPVKKYPAFAIHPLPPIEGEANPPDPILDSPLAKSSHAMIEMMPHVLSTSRRWPRKKHPTPTLSLNTTSWRGSI
ncbi:hypothetical protein M426DRAFT_325309 [Hypoxylon sp. CI-4A]|nr:hypothetical protein M426DRAFT_325309 [Hypoxylon sp. CI-4A]